MIVVMRADQIVTDLDYKIAYYTALLTVGHSATFLRQHMRLSIEEYGSLAYAAEQKAVAEWKRVRTAVGYVQNPIPMRSERRQAKPRKEIKSDAND